MISTNFFFELRNEKQSILEIANYLDTSLKGLLLIDKAFETAYFLYKKESIPIDIRKNDSSIILANHILENSKRDIVKFDKVENPDINYSRPFGFTFGLQFRDEGKKLVALTFKLGSSVKNTIGTISISNEFRKDFDWYKSVLSSFVQEEKVYCACARPNDLAYLERGMSSYKFTLGWITYISNDYEIPIPDDLKGVEYEHADNGKYLILTREDFISEPERFEAGKQKLLEIMEEIKRRVPEYSK
jgi:hypothetical protein